MIEKDLNRPFLLRVAETGRIEALGTEAGAMGMGYNILRSVVSTLQFVEPSGSSPNWSQWDTEESDQNGTYQARYRKQESGQFEKTKLSYSYAATALLSAGKTSRAPTVQSLTKLVWRDGRLSNADMSEAMMQPFGETGAFNTKLHIALSLLSARNEPPQLLDTAGITFLQLFEGKDGPTSVEKDQKRKRELLAGASFDELKSELAKLPDAVGARDARSRMVERLTAMLELEPATLGAVLRELRNSPPSADRELLLASVSDANTPEARAALGDLARDRGVDTPLRDSALVHLGLSKQPDAESIQTVQQIAGDASDAAVHATATLALGSAASAGAKTDASRPAAARAVQSLTDGLARATSPSEQRLYLVALGNAGSQAALDAIKAALASQDPSVRAAAGSALRGIAGPVADGLLASTLRGDPEPRVRAAAVTALDGRELTPPLVAALSEGLRVDEDGSVRQGIIATLGMLIAKAPAARSLLQWSAANDPVEALRDMAAKALQPA